MPLLPPRVVGPLSECSSWVRVQGQLTGSTVTVLADGVQVAQGVAAWATQEFALAGGASLVAGAMVTATQTVGVDTSVPSPEPVEVQGRPPVVGMVGFASNLTMCGECVALEGLVPGAKVEVRVQSGATLGAGLSYDGNARLHLGPPIAAGNVIEAQQEACGSLGVVTTGPPVDVLAEKVRRLPTPRVESPLKECSRAVTVADVVHGATVTLLRSAGPNLTACFDASALYFPVNPALALGETISARQELRAACKLVSADAAVVVVEDNTPVPPASVKGPLCEGSTTVTVTGIILGSRVRIQENGVDLGDAEAPAAGEFDFLVPPLTAGSTISAIQELCGEWSAPGSSIVVDPGPGSLPTPKVQGPLFACATVVRVTNLHPGVRVYVYSTMLAGPIGEKQVFAAEADVPVAPMLIEGDEIFAVQRGCGLVSSLSARVPVQGLEELPAPKVARPLYSCVSAVEVTGVVPGARVDVYVEGVFRGTEKTGGTTVTVPVSGTLHVGEHVTARQRLCDRVSRLSKPVTVEEFLGRWRRVGGDSFAEILAVHAALLHTGKIIYFGGDQHEGSLNTAGDVDHTRLFDCETETLATVTGLPGTSDLFCSGHSLLADGRLLTGGGTRNWGGGGIHPGGHFIGLRDSWLFDPDDDQWHKTGNLVTQRAAEVPAGKDIEKTGGRWYPTLLTLPNGRVLAVSGHPEVDDTRHNNNSLEVYDPSSGTWSIVGAADYSNIDSLAARQYEYPRLHVLPDGTVVSMSTMTNGNLERWHPYSDATDWDHVIGPAPDPMYGGFAQDTTSVLLPLRPSDGYRARLLLAGASMPYVLDMGNLAGGWLPAPRNMVDYPSPGDVNPRRENLDALILPTGEVFIEGGVKNPSSDATAVKRAELFDPEGGGVGTWKVLPEAQRPRQYHSVALLMPNGAVWVAGSNFNSSTGLANRELRVEIFEPWYFCGPRPVITDASTKACHGEQIEIRTPNPAAVQRVVLVRCGSVTHNFNPDQRHITLEFSHDKGDLLVATVPSNAAVAVPGYYLLFVLDANRRPSEGRFIQICSVSTPGHPWPWEDFWKWLADLLRERFELDAADVRRLRRELAGPRAPARRRLEAPGPRHGEHDHGEHDHGEHDHRAEEDERDHE